MGIKKLVEWLAPEEEELSNENKDIKSIPTLAGAKNQSGFNKPIPLVLGEHLLTPFYCGSPYHIVTGEDGEEQYFTALYMLGYNDIAVSDIKLGLIDLASNSHYLKITGYKEKTLFGNHTVKFPIYETVNEGRDNGLLTVDGLYKGDKYDIKLELQQSDEVSIYPQKVVEEQLSIELTHLDDKDNKDGTNILEADRFSAKYPEIVELEFTLQGLVGYDKEGKSKKAKVKIALDVSFDGGKTFEYFATPSCYDLDKNEIESCRWSKGNEEEITVGTEKITVKGTATIEKNKAKVMRFVARRKFNIDEVKKICEQGGGYAQFRIIRINAQSTENNTQDKIALSAIRTWVFDKTKTYEKNEIVKQTPLIEEKRKITARLGLRIKADEIHFKNQIDSLNCIVKSKARIWDSDSKKWSDDLQITSNPASLMLMTLQHKSRKKYAYSDDKIYLEKLGEFYEWCEQTRTNPDGKEVAKYSCNGVLTNQKKTREIVDAILQTARAKLILDNNKWSVWIDKPQDYPVMILNNQNVLSASNTKDFKERPNGYKIKFINARNGYQSDERKVCYDDKDENNPEATFEQIEMLFVTDEAQVYQNGKYLLACNKLRPETWNRKVSIDGNLLDIGCKVAVQDDTISVGIGEGAEIKSIIVDGDYIKGIVTDGLFTVDDLSQSYGVMITQTFNSYSAPIVIKKKVKITELGIHKAFVFEEPISLNETQLPCEGDIISFGIYDKVTTEALVFGKKDNGDGTFDLTLVPYQEGIYNIDNGIIPEFDSKVTKMTDNVVSNLEMKTATITDVIESINNASYGLAPSQYTIDVSPELQSIPCSKDGKIAVDYFSISAYLYYKDALCENVIYDATIDGNSVGNWSSTNTVKISSSYLKGDRLDIQITAKTQDGFVRYATATVSKLYAGEDGDLTLYKMQFPNGEKIKCDASRENFEPKKIVVKKRKNIKQGEFDTEYGYITTEFVPSELKEQEFNTYSNIADSENISENEVYFEKYKPFLLKIRDDSVLGNNSEGLVFYKRGK